MKKLLILLIIISFISCSKEDCRCTGNFELSNGTFGQILDVDCENGSLSDVSNLIFLGCVN